MIACAAGNLRQPSPIQLARRGTHRVNYPKSAIKPLVKARGSFFVCATRKCNRTAGIQNIGEHFVFVDSHGKPEFRYAASKGEQMSEEKKLCPKCNTMTMHPVEGCVVPKEILGLGQKPISTQQGIAVMPYHCPQCRYVELYSTAPLVKEMSVGTLID
ncbi:MAG: hypothetical protein QOJ51_635 [Acidobacteriaceae bacterium]|nr:hypothetical protein [Acidobacteriaceae bacterium]